MISLLNICGCNGKQDRRSTDRKRTTRELRSRDLFCAGDLDPMTLIYELDLDILKSYPRSKNEVCRSRLSEVRARTGQTNRHTDRQTRPNALLAPFTGGSRRPRTRHANTLVAPVTLTLTWYKLDLDILKIYRVRQNKVAPQSFCCFFSNRLEL